MTGSRKEQREDHKAAWISRELQGSDNPGYFASRLFDALEREHQWKMQAVTFWILSGALLMAWVLK
jgi:hypothetical protein